MLNQSTNQNLIKQLQKLSKDELKNLIQQLNNSSSQEDINRFENGVVCPICGKKHIQKFGKSSGIQRYKCKDCGKTFTEYTKTVFFCTKKDYDTWFEYIELMMMGLSLAKIADRLKMSVLTSFRWRHKVLNAIKKQLQNETVSGIVEADETFILDSHKGKHIEGVKSRKRGGVASHRGISKQQVGIMVAIDGDKNIVADIYGKGRLSVEQVEQVLGGKIEDESIFVTDSHHSYMKFAKNHNLKHKRIATGKHKNGIYHINNVNSYHSGLKDFVRQFKGISTKYLDNYLNWFSWIRKGGDNNLLVKECLFGC